MDGATAEMEFPGFRFHPTEEELLNFYLKNMIFGKKLWCDIIGFLNIYRHDPRELPGLAKIGEREWYFFVPRDRKHGSGGRPNRTTEQGFWKATGSDRKISNPSDPKKMLGFKKTLVFYKGRAPRGYKTDWVMNEYRLPDACCPLPKDIVLCKIYRKATSMKVLERAATEGDIKAMKMENLSPTPMDTRNDIVPPPPSSLLLKNDSKAVDGTHQRAFEGRTRLKIQAAGKENLTELHLPNSSMDWTQDSFWTQLRSPWLDNPSLTPYANVLNF